MMTTKKIIVIIIIFMANSNSTTTGYGFVFCQRNGEESQGKQRRKM
jgi:hypothetical protein